MKKFRTYAAIAMLSFLSVSCSKNTETELYQSSRDNIINAKALIHRIDLGDVFVGQYSYSSVYDDFIVLTDSRSYDKLINVFDKNTFEHIISFGDYGEGPAELINIGEPIWNAEAREFYVPDYSKYVYLAYNFDSLLSNANYKPYEKFKIKTDKISTNLNFLSDTFSIGMCIRPIGTNDFAPLTSIVDLKTGEMKTFNYIHPDIHKKRFDLAVSYDDNLIAECAANYDLISLLDMKGNLIKNIYGPQWGTTPLCCFGTSIFTKKYLVALYNGDIWEEHTPDRKCIIFTKQGDYIATLNLEYATNSVCYDADNDRLIFSFNDEIQFGYLNIGELNL